MMMFSRNSLILWLMKTIRYRISLVLKGLILSWLLLMIPGNFCQAQSPNVADTLESVDSNIIESLIREHTKSKLEYKIVETRERLNQAKINKDQKEVGNLMLMLGSLYMETGKFDASLQTLDELNSITTDDTVRLKIYYNKASLFRMALRYDDAIEELMQLRKLNKKVGNQTVEAYALNQIGVIYAMQKSTDVA